MFKYDICMHLWDHHHDQDKGEWKYDHMQTFLRQGWIFLVNIFLDLKNKISLNSPDWSLIHDTDKTILIYCIDQTGKLVEILYLCLPSAGIPGMHSYIQKKVFS